MNDPTPTPTRRVRLRLSQSEIEKLELEILARELAELEQDIPNVDPDVSTLPDDGDHDDAA